MNFLKLLGNIGNLAKMQEEVGTIHEELNQYHYDGSAGGDMVKVKVTGAQQLVECNIDPKLIEDNDRELIEELVVSAVNSALTDAKLKSAQLLQEKLAERLDMPELSGILQNLMPKS